MSNNSVYTVTCNEEGKVVYPSNFVEANKIGSGDRGPIDFTKPIETNGIHEQNVYTTEPSYSMKGWYLASQIFNPYHSWKPSEAIEDPNLNICCVLLSHTRVPYEEANAVVNPTDSNANGYYPNSNILSELEHGDILTFKNDWNLINAVKVDYVEGNRLWFKYIPENLNDNYTPYMWGLQEYGDHILGASVRCFEKPDAGYVEFGEINSTAVGGGSNISRGYLSTTIGGRRNINNADFTTVIGEDNRADGKSSFIIGNSNTLLQEECGIAGHRNEIDTNVRQGFIFGGNNKIHSENTVLLGRGLERNKQKNSLTGVYVGRFNNPDEDGAFVVGTGQGFEDKYNSIVVTRTKCAFRGQQEFTTYQGGDKFNVSHSVVSLGSNNQSNNNTGAYMLGAGLKRLTGSGSQVIVGRFNVDNANSIFTVGVGSTDNEKNAIEVYTDETKFLTNVKFAGSITGALRSTATKVAIGNGNPNLESLPEKSFLFGAGLLSSGAVSPWYQVVTGCFNQQDNDAVFIAGNGKDGNNRNNAITVYKNGDIKLSGKLYLNGDYISDLVTRLANYESVINDLRAQHGMDPM